jgi:hypothetical protein
LAQGFLVDRKQRLGVNKATTDEELADIFAARLTLVGVEFLYDVEN